MPLIRPPRTDELERLQEIEVLAGASFRATRHSHVADHDPFSIPELEAYVAAEHAWVIEDDQGGAGGYLVLDLVDGLAHVEQVSVDPAHRGQGLGRRLLDHGEGVARDEGRAAITLTTFRDVPWNAPYYERCGYHGLADDERGPELVALMEVEASHGLDPADRVAMRKDLA